MFTLTRNKNWYRMGTLEYSTNFRFFKEHQIITITRGNSLYVISKEDNSELEVIELQPNSNEIYDFDLNKRLMSIHNNLLNGKYGQGVFIN